MISKPNNKAFNVHFVIHANEKTLPIAGLCLSYFEKYCGLDNINISVIGNKFITDNLPYKDKVNYISPNIDFDDGGHHFSPVLTKACNEIKEDYIFFFCEDYMLVEDVDFNALDKLVALMNGDNVDMFSFAANQPAANNFQKYENNVKYGFVENDIYHVWDGYMYQYSVQPCLWRKSSLLELLNHNPTLRLHHLDTSHIKGKAGTYRTIDHSGSAQKYVGWTEKDKYNHKILCPRHMIFDYYPEAGQRFVINYIEVLKTGKFILPENSRLAVDNRIVQLIFKMIDDNNLKNNPDFNRYF